MLDDTLSPLNFTNMQILIIVSIVCCVDFGTIYSYIVGNTLDLAEALFLIHHKIRSYRIFLITRAILIQMPIYYCHSLTHRPNTETTKSFENNIFHIENLTIIASLNFNIFQQVPFQLKLISQIQVVNKTSKQKKIGQVHSACLGSPKSKVEFIYNVSITNLLLIFIYLQTINNDLVHDQNQLNLIIETSGIQTNVSNKQYLCLDQSRFVDYETPQLQFYQKLRIFAKLILQTIVNITQLAYEVKEDVGFSLSTVKQTSLTQ
ncbi:Hypothetical_protein [Hexamita inflata]|uniref:Hypothetical_protein n=1 Tax=Hexamita inflata TaxID=28002 RepID=A0AA86VUD1_9EUKA|nr:Hypothetical protein HINF_LOCUS66243 [Hexamita inflata]